jgi:hypothetical protein
VTALSPSRQNFIEDLLWTLEGGIVQLPEEDPRIEDVDHVDNSAAVTFKGEGTTIYPAKLLYAAKELAEVLNEIEEEKQMKEG